MVSIIFGNGEVSTSKENLILSRGQSDYDYLLFFDSRGSITFFSDLLDKLDLKYLIISRPKNLTVLSTLNNFLKLNPKLKFKNLITNLGFVDCTPKKQENIDDILSQIKQFSSLDTFIIQHDKYMLSNGRIEVLSSIEYSEKYIEELGQLLNQRFEKCYLINTPIVPEYMKMDRIRPKSFFKQLYKTNELINKIVDLNENNILVDIKDLNYTYDGVHYTKEGHKLIFNKIKESMNL